MQKAKTVEAYLKAKSEWREELDKLRSICTSTKLEETVKWGAPCYVHEGRNIVSLAAFKGYVGLWFFDSEHLPDPDGVLQTAEGGKSKSMRQWRFTSAKDIKKTAVKRYLQAAMKLSADPAKPKTTTAKKLVVPAELAAALEGQPKLKKAFDQLSPGKQREYADHVSEAKREATRAKRLEKIVPMILEGKGLNDRYRC